MGAVMPRFLQRLAHQRPDGQVRDVVVVHDVEVDEVGASGEHRLDLLAQTCEVGGQDRRRDERLHRLGSDSGGSGQRPDSRCATATSASTPPSIM